MRQWQYCQLNYDHRDNPNLYFFTCDGSYGTCDGSCRLELDRLKKSGHIALQGFFSLTVYPKVDKRTLVYRVIAKLGEDSWEMVNAAPTYIGSTLYSFKRPKTE